MTDPTKLHRLFSDQHHENVEFRFPVRGVVADHDGSVAHITVPAWDGGANPLPVNYSSTPALSPGTLVLVVRDEVDSYWIIATEGGDAGPGTGGTTPQGQTGSANPKDKASIIKVIKSTADSHGVPATMAIATCYVETNLGVDMHSAGSSYYGWYQMSLAPSEPYSNAGLHDQPSLSQAENLSWACDLFCKAAAARVASDPSLNDGTYLNWAMLTQGVNSSNNPRYPNTWSSYMAQAKSDLARYAP